jgi:hypothetical protein
VMINFRVVRLSISQGRMSWARVRAELGMLADIAQDTASQGQARPKAWLRVCFAAVD